MVIFLSYSPQWIFLELIRPSEVGGVLWLFREIHAQVLFRENLQEASIKGLQITVILPMKCALNDSVFLVLWLFTLHCPEVGGPFVAGESL